MNIRKTALYLTIFFPFQILFVTVVSNYPDKIETYYSQGIYPAISGFLRLIFGWLPFSFGDVLGLILSITILYSTYKLIKNRFKNFFSALLKLTALFSTLYFCFYCFWGLNYFREPLAKSLNLQQAEYSTEQLTNTTKEIIAQLNYYHLEITKNDTLKVISPYSTAEIYKKSPDGYAILAKTYPQLNYKTPSIKNSLVSLMHMYTGTSGYFNPITSEAQVNKRIPKTGLPATACHEIAHQIGWGPENEANFIGFLTATSNPDIYFKYAGYRMAFHYLIKDLKKRDKELTKEVWKTVNTGIIKDFKASYTHWQQYENPIEPYLKKGYNSYLKANNQNNGIKSYNYVVDLLIAYHLKKDLN